MPIYEYECRQCGHRMDALQKMSDPRLTDCPECAQPSLRKLLSAPYFRLKGSGWYETDFKNSGREKPADGAGDGKDGGEDGGKSKTTDANGKDGGKADAKSSGGASGDGDGGSSSRGSSKSGASGASAEAG